MTAVENSENRTAVAKKRKTGQQLEKNEKTSHIYFKYNNPPLGSIDDQSFEPTSIYNTRTLTLTTQYRQFTPTVIVLRIRENIFRFELTHSEITSKS